MNDPFWLLLSKAVKNWAEVFAVLGAGGWAFWRFILSRQNEAAMEIDLSYSTQPLSGGDSLVFCDVKFTNKGPVRLTAKPGRPAYGDCAETLIYSGSLLLRKIPETIKAESCFAWFTDESPRSPLKTDLEIDLLTECENGAETDFWMEPGEVSFSGASLCLKQGNYLAMVTFVGARGKHEFWRRKFLLQIIKVPNESTLGTELLGTRKGEVHARDI
jgi:hypothetical protein